MAELLPDPEDPELDKIVYALALEASADGKAASIPRVVERLRPTKTALGFRKPEILWSLFRLWRAGKIHLKHPQETKQRWEIGDPYDDLLLLEIPLEDLKDPAPNLLMTVGAFVPLTKKGKTKLELVGVASAFQGPASTAKVQVTTLEGKARLIDIDLYRDIAKRARATGAQRLITEVPCGQADGIGRAGGWRKAGECGDNGMQAWESGAKGTA